ncbi:PH domain-containing protein [Parapedobacter pyrenivorans]|nr:PH domain-containing protein [Parapedobacter pyrenivorans]
MQKHKAKIDLILFIPTAAIMLGSTLPLVFMAINESSSAAAVTEWGFALLMLITTIFCIQLFLSTYYIINSDQLIIRSGMLYRKRVAISSIRKVKATRNPISSPAPSLDRLEIFYNKFDSVIISPKDKAAFIASLIKLNPEIEVV